jgi:FtsP/CotA-like multicopper oxidase with cupredoxin domain
MTDWNQRSAFQDWAWSVDNKSGFAPPKMTSILLNGEGVAPPGTCTDPKPAKLHTLNFQKGVRYLLRLINTSVDTTFIFSIDGHNLTVVGADFVPIHNYTTESVLIGIGQRYHVIVEANPIVPTTDGNYWIRTVPADGCKFFAKDYYNVTTSTTGIVRYDHTNQDDPTSQNLTFPLECSDEPYDKLRPIVKWTVPQNNITEDMDVHLVQGPNTEPYQPQWPTEPNFRRWQLYKAPLWLNFSDPTILNVEANTNNFTAELSVNTKVSAEDQWIELLITGLNSTFAAHPIHLHGHDFALLAQSDQPWTGDPSVIKRDNPPRRDVALLRKGGYLLIAFKADNPGMTKSYISESFQ